MTEYKNYSELCGKINRNVYPPVSVNHDGPNYQFHAHFYDGYNKHFLLHTGDRPNRLAPMMHNALKSDFPEHRVELTPLEIADLIFFSPGTSIM
jgi:hypothetical protein